MANDDKKSVEIDYNVKEIINNLDKTKVISPEDKKRIEESLDFEGTIKKIDITGNDNRVVFTDGEEQLVYEDGEFFIISSTDSLKTKSKKTRKEARDMYIEYFIKYYLNPISKQKQINEMARTISVCEPTKTKPKFPQAKDVRKELGNKVKSAPDRESNTLNKQPKQVGPKQKSR